MKPKIKYLWIGFICVLSFQMLSAQGFMHRDGKKIADKNGNNFIIRSIGTGNWFIQEGYMMKSADIAGTQHEFRAKLEQSIGKEKTDSFYNVWLHNHMSKADIDSMKAWGFNAIRPALHYLWFTPPIEDEPVSGEITWINKGFELVDSLLNWCSLNEMYIILDMHGTPGGQGTDSNISDYDPSKPSLWESRENQDKLIALWRKIAERYKDETWIGGYDLINEPNWTFEEDGNAPMWSLYKEITEAVREVDTNHMIIIEGNWFANNYDGLPEIWDNNLALSFHKYWNINDVNAIQWMLDLRNERNVPIWLGESGENSNTWFTNAIALCESKNIGWSWWPVKKAGINNVLQVMVNEDYTRLIDSWKGDANSLSEKEVFQAVLTFAENHKIENCLVNYDVIDALMRQPKSFESKPFKTYTIGNEISFVDYDLGRNKVAYFDNDTSNIRLTTGTYVNWNQGWSYRNDGVDIQECDDKLAGNGYNVAWAEKGEWMQYTINVDSTASYTLDIRSASESKGSSLHLELNGEIISENIKLPSTGSWQTWKTTSVNNIVLPKGENKIRFYSDEPGSNLNYFVLSEPKPIEEKLQFLYGNTDGEDNTIHLFFNKEITQLNITDAINEFVLLANSQPVEITNVSQGSVKELILTYDGTILFENDVWLSFQGSSIQSNDIILESFENKTLVNNRMEHITIPGKIEAEDFLVNNGMTREDCEDFGGGYDMGYADDGDYLEYFVYVQKPGEYKLDIRVATEYSDAQLHVLVGSNNNFNKVGVVNIENTGAWQTWKTQSIQVNLTEGVQRLRIFVEKGQYNLNWIKFSYQPVTVSSEKSSGFRIYPNPTMNRTILDFSSEEKKSITLLNTKGNVLFSAITQTTEMEIDTSFLTHGIYYVIVETRNGMDSNLLVIN